MWLPDVNILVYAHREDLPAHNSARGWLESSINGIRPVGLFEPTLAGFLRITTNRRIFKTPSPLEISLAFVENLRKAPAVRPLTTGPNQWTLFTQLCRQINATGNDVPDAYLAALAIDNDCEFVSTDTGFGRFPGLKLFKPF